MPGINAKITSSVSPASFPWLSKILAPNFLLRPSWSSSYFILIFIPFSYSHFCRIFPGLKDLVQRISLLFFCVTLECKLLRTTDFKQLQIMTNHRLGFQTCICYVETRRDLSAEVQTSISVSWWTLPTLAVGQFSLCFILFLVVCTSSTWAHTHCWTSLTFITALSVLSSGTWLCSDWSNFVLKWNH